jgi:hypothetical protein
MSIKDHGPKKKKNFYLKLIKDMEINGRKYRNKYKGGK